MYLAVDIGGTKTLLALFDNNGQIIKTEKFQTPPDYQEFLAALNERLQSFPRDQLQAAAIGVPGRLDRQLGVVLACGNLPWEHQPLKADLASQLNIPVIHLENDAKLAALGESKLIINEYKKVLYITISTGIGIGVTINGKLSPDLLDAEPGFMQVWHGDRYQTWEDFASGQAIQQRYGKQANDIPAGDPLWEQIAADLAPQVFNVISIVQPQVTVIGGGVGQHLDHFHDVLVRHLKQFESKLVPVPPLRQAQHAEQAVIYGAYALLTDHANAAQTA